MNFNLQKLRYERLSRKITQKQMASALGINRSSYYKKESGRIKISIEEFSIILDVLGISCNEVGNFFAKKVPIREQDAV
ncbi:helix-turn-helix transcriptional regulator [Paenibacillus larvae]